MGKVYYNGLHWNVVGDPNSPNPQYTAGNKFSAAFIQATGNISYAGYSTGTNDWRTQVDFAKANGRAGEVVLRLYWYAVDRANPNARHPLEGDPGQSLGTQFYQQIVSPAYDKGVRNFQVLNELNIEYEDSRKSRAALAGDMYNIAWWIKKLAKDAGKTPIYLGFPGPGDRSYQDPNAALWRDYWNAYKSTITQATQDGAAYNWLAPHCYGISRGELTGRMQAQYDWLRTNIPNYPHRWTEYSIGLEAYGCTPPCNDPAKFQTRADECKLAIQDFKRYVDARTGPDVWSVFYYLAFDSNAGSQDGTDKRFELVLDNARLGPAQSLASAF